MSRSRPHFVKLSGESFNGLIRVQIRGNVHRYDGAFEEAKVTNHTCSRDQYGVRITITTKHFTLHD